MVTIILQTIVYVVCVARDMWLLTIVVYTVFFLSFLFLTSLSFLTNKRVHLYC